MHTMKKRLLTLARALLLVATTLFASGCDMITSFIGNLINQGEETTPETTTPEPDAPQEPSVFDGIEFSDPAVVIPAAYALATGATLEECSEALYAGGAYKVIPFVLAKALMDEDLGEDFIGNR